MDFLGEELQPEMLAHEETAAAKRSKPQRVLAEHWSEGEVRQLRQVSQGAEHPRNRTRTGCSRRDHEGARIRTRCRSHPTSATAESQRVRADGRHVAAEGRGAFVVPRRQPLATMGKGRPHARAGLATRPRLMHALDRLRILTPQGRFCEDVRHVVCVMASSRGGSSVSMEMFRHSRSLLHFRGEDQPLLGHGGLGLPQQRNRLGCPRREPRDGGRTPDRWRRDGSRGRTTCAMARR